MSIFTHVPVKKPRRTAFNLSHNYKMTGEMGVLYPILCQDVVPGDTFKLNSAVFCRLLPMIAPLMSRVRIYTHFFFVPKRLVWDHWQEFITGASQSKSRQEIDEFVPPLYPRFLLSSGVINATGDSRRFFNGDLADYLGFPVFDRTNSDGRLKNGSNSNVVVLDALPFRAYQLIWNEYFRDENLQDEVDIFSSGDGEIDVTSARPTGPKDYFDNLSQLRRRAWKKDYFTSALPFAQAGPDVTLPLTGYAGEDPLYVDYLPRYKGTDPNRVLFGTSVLGPTGLGLNAEDAPLFNKNGSFVSGDQSSSGIVRNLDVPRVTKDVDNPLSVGRSVLGVDNTQLQDLFKNIGSATINELRRAFAAQRFLEATARGGSRYIEQLYSIFGVRSSDARLQRPEYLGGSVQDIVVSDVLQTSATVDGQTPQANQAGIGASLSRAGGFYRWFEEHGYVIGLLSVLPDASYQQGMPKQFTKFDRFDHYWPQFAHLGEQEIKQTELYYTGSTLDEIIQGSTFENAPVFGYTPRYAEYKYIPSTVHGDFRDTLSFWHLGRIFDKAPGLNSSFIEARPRKDVFAVSEAGTHHFLFNIQHNLRAIRPMPRFGVPS